MMRWRLRPKVHATDRPLVLDTFSQFFADKCPRLAAAIAYYTLASLIPLLYLMLLVASVAYDTEVAQQAIVAQVRTSVGVEAADLVGQALGAMHQSSGWQGALLGAGFLLFAATTVFGELQASLNQVWGLQAPRGRPVLRIVRERLLSALMVFTLGALLLASLAANALVSGLAAVGGWRFLYPLLDFAASLAVVTLLVAAIYKVLPDATVHWSDVWWGAFFTSLLLTSGKVLVGRYVGHTAAGSAFGAASALAVLLVWVYFGALVFFFGAEMTEIRAARKGTVAPRRGAIRVLPERVPLEAAPARRDGLP